MRGGGESLRSFALAGALVLAALFVVVVVPRSVSGLTPHAPIQIFGNDEFTPENGVVSGSGAATDPYIIEGWEIDASSANGIDIRNTDAHFVIRNVFVHSGNAANHWGIWWHTVLNGHLVNATLDDNWVGFAAWYSSNVTVESTTSSRGQNGLGFYYSSQVTAKSNNVTGNVWNGIILLTPTVAEIVGNTISDTQNGIAMDSPRNARVQGNVITRCEVAGISFGSASNLTVSGNKVNDSQMGIYVSTGEGIVTDNDLSGNFHGVFTALADGISISSNRIGNNTHGVLLHQTVNAHFMGNRFFNDSIFLEGFVVGQYNSHTIGPDNTVNGLPIRYIKDCSSAVVDGEWIGQLILANCGNVTVRNLLLPQTDAGIHLGFVENATIAGNKVTDSLAGVAMRFVRNVRIASNVFLRDVFGVEAQYSSDFSISENEIFRSTWFGLNLDSSENVDVSSNVFSGHPRLAVGLYQIANLTVLGNVLEHNRAGMYAVTDRNGTFSGNRFTENVAAVDFYQTNHFSFQENVVEGNVFGLWMGEASNTTVFENDFIGNENGLYLSLSRATKVYHNDFVNNTNQSFDDGAAENAWHDGYPTGGNYWSNYGGADNCSGPAQNVCPDPDGIGDTPYTIDFDSIDRYPLMAPFGQPNKSPNASFTASPSLLAVNSLVTVDASSSSDPEDGASLEVRWDWEDDGTWDTSWSTNKVENHAYSAEGTYQIRLQVRDTGGLTAEVTQEVAVDGQAPRTDATVTGRLGTGGWFLGPVTVTLSATDDRSGVDATAYRVDGAAWQTYAGPFVVSGDGRHPVEYFSMDGVGNVEATRVERVGVDTTAPSVNVAVDGTIGADGWYTSQVSVSLSPFDGTSGQKSLAYRVDGASWQSYTAPIALSEGTHILEYEARDAAGNSVSGRQGVRIDLTDPVVAGQGPSGVRTTGRVVVSWSGSDVPSGIDRFEISVDGGPFRSVGTNTSVPLSLVDGAHEVRIRAYDAAGRFALAVIMFRVDTNPFSVTGPYGGLPTYALIGMAVVAVIVLRWYLLRRRLHRNE